MAGTKYYHADEAAEILGICVVEVRAMLSNGDLKGHKFGRRWMVNMDQTGEEFGKESTVTFYWQFNPDKPYFLDYAFCCVKPISCSIGEWERVISGHRPLLIELEEELYDGRPFYRKI